MLVGLALKAHWKPLSHTYYVLSPRLLGIRVCLYLNLSRYSFIFLPFNIENSLKLLKYNVHAVLIVIDDSLLRSGGMLLCIQEYR
jgi:hypothetical protein